LRLPAVSITSTLIIQIIVFIAQMFATNRQLSRSEETYASVLEGKPFSSGAFFRGERGSQVRKQRISQHE